MITLLNYNINGTTVSDETLTINTSEAQVLAHDNFFDIEVYTGASKTGDEITNFVLGLYDSFYSTYNTIQFSSNNGEIVYITYKTKGDYVDADDVNSKADKVTGATNGNLAGLNASGNPTDSGSKAADFATSGHSHSSATTEAAGFMSAAGKTKLDGVADGAEVNQNAFSTVAVSGQSDVVADSKTDTLTFVAGTNVTITTDAEADSITINASGGTTGGTASSDFGPL